MYPATVDDADPKLSKAVLVGNAACAALSLADSIRHRGSRNALSLLALAVGLPAIGELLAVGPLKLLQHRTRPRVAGVPVGILLGWYCAINGSLSVAEDLLALLPVDGRQRRIVLPPVAAMVGVSLDLILDPAGLEAGLWEWNMDGAYANEIDGANGSSGIPIINYVGWAMLVSSVVYIHKRTSKDHLLTNQRPALLLLPHYLAAVVWALQRRRFRYLIYSAPFPIALGIGLRER